MKLRPAITGFFVGLLLLEAVLRITNAAPVRIQGHHIVLRRNRTYHFSNHALRGCDSEIIYATNSLGFRGAEPPDPFPESLTLVAVGGSVTECAYISNGKTWPDLVGDRLRPHFPKIWINNAGIDGQSTYGHLILLQDYLIPLHPNVVLFLVGDGDVDRNDLNHEDKELRLEGRSRGFQIDQWIIDHSRLAALLQNIVLGLRAHQRGIGHSSVDLKSLPLADAQAMQSKPLTILEQQALDGYRERLQRLIEAAQRAGIAPILITHPALYGPAIDPQTEVDLNRIVVHPGMSGAEAWAKLERYNTVTRQTAGRAGVLLIDLAEKLPKDSAFFYDFSHFTNAGAEKAAQLIADALNQTLPVLFPRFYQQNTIPGNSAKTTRPLKDQ